MVAVGKLGQLAAIQRRHLAIGDRVGRQYGSSLTTGTTIKYGSVALPVVEGVRDSHCIILVRQVERGGNLTPHGAPDGDVDGGRGQREGDAVARDLDLQHGDQAHVAQPAVVAGRLPDGGIVGGGVGGVLGMLHLAFRVLGPVEDVEGVGQVIGVGGAVLQIDQHGPLAIHAQVVHLQGEGLVGVKR